MLELYDIIETKSGPTKATASVGLDGRKPDAHCKSNEANGNAARIRGGGCGKVIQYLLSILTALLSVKVQRIFSDIFFLDVGLLPLLRRLLSLLRWVP